MVLRLMAAATPGSLSDMQNPRARPTESEVLEVGLALGVVISLLGDFHTGDI